MMMDWMVKVLEPVSESSQLLWCVVLCVDMHLSCLLFIVCFHNVLFQVWIELQ